MEPGAETRRPSANSSHGVFALRLVGPGGETVAIAVWNASSSCGHHNNGSVALNVVKSQALCFTVTNLVGEQRGKVCRRSSSRAGAFT